MAANLHRGASTRKVLLGHTKTGSKFPCLVQAGTRRRRLLVYYQSPGCRQGTILAPVTAWRRLPGTGGAWPLDILICSAAQWLPQTTSSQVNGRTIRAHERADKTAPPGHGPADHGGHGGHGRPLQSRPVKAVIACHGGHGRSRRSRPATAERRDGGAGRRGRLPQRTPHSRTILSHDPYG